MRWVVFVMLCGCSSILGIEDFKLDGGGGGEMGARFCRGAGAFEVCVASEPTEPKTIDSVFTLDTKPATMFCGAAQPESWKAAGQPDACFVVASEIEINGELTVIGPRPLVLFAAKTITLTRSIDVASHISDAQIGAGSPSPSCNAPVAAGASGGGGGGSFMTKGGKGGAGASGGAGNSAEADGERPMKLRGGCPGGTGVGSGGSPGGAGGRGGGAIYLVAGERITFNDASINASGSGGGAGGSGAGGGGGGTGGMIVLHAPVITGTAGVLVANGGGGGGGGGGGTIGSNGMETVPTSPSVVARGGNGGGGGGAGGGGFAGSMLAVVGANGSPSTATGGGGGGGASGYIVTNVMPTQIAVSPPVQLSN